MSISRFAVFSFASVFTSSVALAASSAKVAKSDVSFIEKAARGSIMEVEAGKVALEKSQNAEVKEFAQHLVDDHTKLNEELSNLVAPKGVIMASAMNPAQKKIIAKLSETPADKFDAAFIRTAIDDHKKDIAEFEKAAQSAKDHELRDWVNATLPKLKMHLEMANKLKA